MPPTKPRSIMLAVILVLAVLAPLPAIAEDVEEPIGFTPESIVFPVIGDVSYSDTFGAPRSAGRVHEGTDLMSVGEAKGLPVVAAADGVVDWIGSDCCYLSIDHGGGWETWYIHLDNDTAGTDDGLGWGIAPGIAVGTPVVQGQLIGWLGDSGNAEETTPHLHFEIRTNAVAINAYEYLLTAPVLSEPGASASWEGRFRDDDDSVHEANIEVLFAEGITKGCNPPTNDMYCPSRALSRGQVTAFLRRHLDLAPVGDDYFSDDATSVFEEDINALTAAGIAFGCTEAAFCPSVELTRAEMAEFLVRTFGYQDPEGGDYFGDDEGNAHEEAINVLYANGITVGCTPTDYCPDDSLTRGQMATFLARALGLGS